MAAPVPTPRTVPSGWKMKEGYQAVVTFSNKPAVQLWEKEVTPTGWDGGDPIDTTTQFNTRYRTKAPPALVDLTEAQYTCGYDPDVYNDINGLIGVEQTVTIRFPDRSTICFYGYMRSFKPSGLKEKTFPEATVVIIPTNYDPVNNVEAGPVFTAAAGT